MLTARVYNFNCRVGSQNWQRHRITRNKAAEEDTQNNLLLKKKVVNSSGYYFSASVTTFLKQLQPFQYFFYFLLAIEDCSYYPSAILLPLASMLSAANQAECLVRHCPHEKCLLEGVTK